MNYRGIKPAHIVTVLEGKGTEESPYMNQRYVLEWANDGGLKTAGKLVELTEEERRNFD